MSLKVTRRQLAAALAGAATAARRTAHTDASPAAWPSAQEAACAENAAAIAKVPLPQTTEPAFHFEA